jgi:cytochrome c556
MMKALPMPFKQLGMSTHKKFDELAASAEQGASDRELLGELSQLMNNCIACHATYQLQPAQPAAKN